MEANTSIYVVVSAAGERTSGQELTCEACKVRLRSVICALAAAGVRQGSKQLAHDATSKQCKVRVFSNVAY